MNGEELPSRIVDARNETGKLAPARRMPEVREPERRGRRNRDAAISQVSLGERPFGRSGVAPYHARPLDPSGAIGNRRGLSRPAAERRRLPVRDTAPAARAPLGAPTAFLAPAALLAGAPVSAAAADAMRVCRARRAQLELSRVLLPRAVAPPVRLETEAPLAPAVRQVDVSAANPARVVAGVAIHAATLPAAAARRSDASPFVSPARAGMRQRRSAASCFAVAGSERQRAVRETSAPAPSRRA